MMVRLRSKTTQITATISPFRADPGGTQIPIVILSTRIQIFLHFGSINGLSLSVYLRTNLAGTLGAGAGTAQVRATQPVSAETPAAQEEATQGTPHGHRSPR